MARRLLNLLTLLSLLLCVAVAALWVRSYQAHDVLSWRQADNVGGERYSWYRVVASGRGQFAYSCDAEVYQLPSITSREAARALGRWQWLGWQRGFVGYPAPGFGGSPNLWWGFHFAWRGDLSTMVHEVVVPYWAMALPAAFLPVWWVLRKLRPPARPGTCRRCGYDLRATPDRCPECGTITAPRAAR